MRRDALPLPDTPSQLFSAGLRHRKADLNGTPRRGVDWRLLRYAGAARAHLVLTVALGLVGTG